MRQADALIRYRQFQKGGGRDVDIISLQAFVKGYIIEEGTHS